MSKFKTFFPENTVIVVVMVTQTKINNTCFGPRINNIQNRLWIKII